MDYYLVVTTATRLDVCVSVLYMYRDVTMYVIIRLCVCVLSSAIVGV